MTRRFLTLPRRYALSRVERDTKNAGETMYSKKKMNNYLKTLNYVFEGDFIISICFLI
jgi:hypothetical protein